MFQQFFVNPGLSQLAQRSGTVGLPPTVVGVPRDYKRPPVVIQSQSIFVPSQRPYPHPLFDPLKCNSLLDLARRDVSISVTVPTSLGGSAMVDLTQQINAARRL